MRQYEHFGKSVLTEKSLKYNDQDATAIRKHCHKNNYQADSFCFTLIGSASNNFHLKLKESLLILKLKPHVIRLMNCPRELQSRCIYLLP